MTEKAAWETERKIEAAMEESGEALEEFLIEEARKNGLRVEELYYCRYHYHEKWKCPQGNFRLGHGTESMLFIAYNPTPFTQRIPQITAEEPNYEVSVWQQDRSTF